MDDVVYRATLERHHSDAWALCLCRRDRDEAESVLQTAYVHVLSRKASFAVRSAFRTWLFAYRLLCAPRRCCSERFDSL